ncbi:DUF2911 domain-containing protein [Emticicia sp. SJ17W-69]|uniref:DUF2911 domain-containing protein n=1 Tax=Emticicia sp. SJ17W-69 TaxID=3421657 RepID=UPI003EBAA439
MKRTVFFIALLFVVFNLSAQDKASRPSPPAQATATINGKTITIDYSQPSVKGREIWGKLEPYGKVWRAGANETTAFTLSADATVEGKKLAAGKYAFFVIPNEKEWTIIFNKTIKWGAFSYKQEEDVLRVNVPVKKAKAFTEKLTYEISDKGVVSLTWENATASFKIK